MKPDFDSIPLEIFVAPIHGASSCGYGAWYAVSMTNGDKSVPNVNLISYTRTKSPDSGEKKCPRCGTSGQHICLPDGSMPMKPVPESECQSPNDELTRIAEKLANELFFPSHGAEPGYSELERQRAAAIITLALQEAGQRLINDKICEERMI